MKRAKSKSLLADAVLTLISCREEIEVHTFFRPSNGFGGGGGGGKTGDKKTIEEKPTKIFHCGSLSQSTFLVLTRIYLNTK